MKFKSDIEVQAGLKDSSGSNGTSGQVLSSNGTTVSWVPAGSSVASDVQNEVKAGVAIGKGQAVYVTSADGTNIIVGLASNTTEATSSKTLGLLNATVAANGFADVVQIGRLAGLNTSAATVGDPVWLGANGNLIYGLANKPYAPLHLVFIGVVTRVNASNGEIFINVQNGFELNEIHDVDIKTTVPINGDVLGYNGTLWVNKTIAGWLGYTPADQAITISTTAPLSGGGNLSANRTLSITQAGTASNGYLSSTDWNTFNNKQTALNGTGFVKASGTTISYDNSTYVPTSRTITINGVGYDLSADRSWTVSGGVGGSGDLNRVPKFTASTTIGNSSISDDGTIVSLLNADSRLYGGSNTGRFIIGNPSVTTYAAIYGNSHATAPGLFQIVANNIAALSIPASGNVGIGTVVPINGGSAARWVTAEGTTTYGGGFISSVNGNAKGYFYSQDGYAILQGAPSQGVKLMPNGVDGITVFSAGNVFIGTSPTDAGYKLNVSGDFLASGFTKSYTGNVNSDNYFEKVFSNAISFPNGSANLAADVRFGNTSFWGYIEVEVTATYSNQNSAGKLTKVFAVGTNPNNLIYTNESRVVDSMGTISDNIAIGDFSWDGTNSTYKIPISHIVSSGNLYTVKVRMFTHGSGAWTAFNAITISNNYSLTALPRQYPYYNDRLGVGTSLPVGKFQVTLPTYTNQDTDSQQAIFGSGTNGYGVRIGYSETGNYGVINSLKPGVAWGNLSLQSGGGNVLIGTTTDSGYKLDVNGRGNFSGTIRTTGGGTERYFQMAGYNSSNVAFRSNVGYSTSYNNFGILVNVNSDESGQGNTGVPSWALNLGGNIPDGDSFTIERTPAGSYSFSKLLKISSNGAATFSSSITAGGNITSGGSMIIPSFETATNVLSFRAGIPEGYNVGIRAKAISTANRDGLEILGYNGIDLSTNNGNTVALRTHINGNITINTLTDAGYKLDVNGTVRSQGNLTVNGNAIFGGSEGSQKRLVSIPLNSADYYHRYILLAKYPTFGNATVNAGFRGSVTMERVNGIGIDIHDDFDFTVSYGNAIAFRQTSYQSNQTSLVQLSYNGTQYLALYAYSAPGWAIAYMDVVQTNYGGWLDANTFVAVESTTPLHSSVSYSSNTTAFKQSVSAPNFTGTLYGTADQSSVVFSNSGTTFNSFFDSQTNLTDKNYLIYNTTDAPRGTLGLYTVSINKWYGDYGSMFAVDCEPGRGIGYIKTKYGGTWGNWKMLIDASSDQTISGAKIFNNTTSFAPSGGVVGATFVTSSGTPAFVSQMASGLNAGVGARFGGSNGNAYGSTSIEATTSNYGAAIKIITGVYSASQQAIQFTSNTTSVGSITCTTSATAYNTSSDYRLKENVVALESSINRVKALNPCRFNFITEPEKTVDGFIAHEVQEVIPEAVVGKKDELDYDGSPKYQGIDQSKIVPLLTAALKEAISKIEELENRLSTLENK